jgi:hypothetical protein
MFTRLGRLSLASLILGIAGIAFGLGALTTSYDGPRIEEYTSTVLNHDAQELRTHTCLVWWQAATPEGHGQMLSCERLK